MNLPELPQDKTNHFLYGAMISALVSRATGSRIAGLGAAVVVAVGRELLQRFTGTGDPDPADAAWTVAGGLCPWMAGGVDPFTEFPFV